MTIPTDTQHTEEWSQYQDGINYNERIGLYTNVNKNERFYSGDQWNGVQSNGLPTPVFNIFKRIINYFIASILSQNTAIQFVAKNVGDEPQNAEEVDIKKAAELITQYSSTLFEDQKINQMQRQWLLDAAISGDACGYSFWDDTIDTLQAIKGDINMESVDSVNVFFGNPNDKRVQRQPYILIVFRDLVSNVKAEAKAHGVDEAFITSDIDTDYQSGDRSKIELEQRNGESGKCQVILKLWKEDGKVFAKKSTRFTEIRPKWDTKLSLYPVTWMNWDQRKNSYHGQAVGTGLVPNQIFINKTFAMGMVSLMHVAFPKAIYDKSLIAAWDNQLGASIGIEAGGQPIHQSAFYLNPGNMSDQVFKLIDLAIQYTKDMLGANDAALGDVNPENASGRSIIAVQQQAGIPLESIKQNLYQFIEDTGYIWLDFMANYYGKRKVDVMRLGKRVVEEFDFSLLKKMKFRIKIDVGPSSFWSQITAMQTLDNLLKDERITFLQYLDRIAPGLIPKTQELVEELKSQDIKQQFIWEQMAKYMEQMPPEQRQAIEKLPPEKQEEELMKLMMQPQEQQSPQPQQPQQPDPQQVQQEQAALQQEQDRLNKQHELEKGEQKFKHAAALKDQDHLNNVELSFLNRENQAVESK